MRFEEVLPALREGKKIGRASSKLGVTFTKDEFFRLDSTDLLQADDWEIINETKKVKLRDLAEEQFEKWRDENCKKYDCFDCPFRCIDCNKFFWMSCKDMYSDKFLDQEIEVEE